MSESPEFDDQDRAEALDESMLNEDALADEGRTFEELPDLLDVTQADGDRDDDEALALDADEFDPDAIGDADTEEDDELDLHAATAEHEDDLDGLGREPGGDAE
ncbi:primosomal protein [Phenylobacterium sp.]|uniref:primosomal protein n=1 Tax=Phenylobacterium sp. TaxID=1871053 RepID=UPI0025CF4841|nr:primosomal protein [Phenylobacterium sp.]